MLYYSGKYEETIAFYAKVKQEFPNFPTSYLISAWSYEQLNKPDESFAEEIVFWKMQGVPEPILEKMKDAYRRGGRTEYLRELAGMMENSLHGRYFHEYRPAHTYARLRDREKTLEWIEKGVEKRSSNIVKIYLDPNFDFLRAEPRFQDALRKMNLSG